MSEQQQLSSKDVDIWTNDDDDSKKNNQDPTKISKKFHQKSRKKVWQKSLSNKDADLWTKDVDDPKIDSIKI